MTEPAPEWDSRKEALHWFDHAAFIAQARVNQPAWYSEHAEDYVDILCWCYQRCIDAEYTGPAEAREEEDADPDQTEQQTLIADGGRQTTGTYRCPACEEADVALNGINCADCGTTVEALQNDATSRPPITREHLYGATIWAYGAGGAHIKPWVHSHQFSRFGGGSGAE